jgi:EAL domain-containing protein (putative c-di-GMP-specific phosphodiesterase class I)
VVTAEGIEDPSVVQALVDMGCAQGQGYLFGKPQPAAEFRQLLQLPARDMAPFAWAKSV